MKSTVADPNENSGIYIHFPFCDSRCPYCTFCTFTGLEVVRFYYEYLLAEVDFAAKHFPTLFGEADTVYIGGGTPSLMDIPAIDSLLARIRTEYPLAIDWHNVEVTLEANPENIELDYLKNLRKIGINRLSIGAQRMSDSLLDILGRGHLVEDTVQAVKNARKAGFKNISLDFILGIPGDSEENIKKEIKRLMKLDPEHISVYMLEIKEGSRLTDEFIEELPEDDLTASLYEKTIDILESGGWKQYEISNFAKEGFKSRHNLKYWCGSKWLGLGASAASYSGNARWENSSDLDTYYSSLLEREEKFIPTGAITDRAQLAEEEFFMGMRKLWGISVNELKSRWGDDFPTIDNSKIEEFRTQGFIEFDNDNLKFTRKGFLVSNEIFTRLLKL
ncbi:MAG: radical SAM family heme chaperone HemW [Acidobacteria bacterium]|nr:radical SAM family heme chaperone HemW [Acidobacteriota bacterium]